MQLYDFKEIQERVILVGVQTDIGDDVEASLDELQELAETAGAETAAKVIQNREAVHPGTYIWIWNRVMISVLHRHLLRIVQKNLWA